jgi:hypothetical protein
VESPEAIAARVGETARKLRQLARRLKTISTDREDERAAVLAGIDEAVLALHLAIGRAADRSAPAATAAAAAPTPSLGGEIGLEELSTLLYRTINPPDSRRNFTYTPPFSIERVLRAYLDWISGPGRGIALKRP